MSRPPTDYTGQRFGHLVALSRHEGEAIAWLCRCGCGNEVVLPIGRIRSGLTSCGACHGGVGNPESKPCAICGSRFYRGNRVSDDKWRRQTSCSRACAVQSRQRSKAAMNKHWGIQQARAAAKARIPLRPSREDEEDAIARFVAERGVTRAPQADQEVVPMRQEQRRPQPMAGWR